MKSAIVIFLFGAAISGSAWWLWQSAVPEAAITIVERGDVKHSSPGRVDVLPERAQRLLSLRTGRVESAIMAPNAASREVEHNETIVQFETRAVELSLEEIRVSLKAAEARLEAESEVALQLDTETRELEDFRTLAEEGRFPKKDFLKKEDSIKRLKARLELEKIALNEEIETYRAKEAQSLNHLDDLTIKAPFAGILTEVFISPGDHVFAGNALGILQSREHLVRITLNEEDFQGVEVNQSVGVSFLSHGSKVFDGHVSRLSDVLDSSANKRFLFVELDEGNHLFAAGSSGEAEIIKALKKNVTLVPRRALVGDTVCVWKDGAIEIRKVKVGHRNLLTAEVVNGLKVGERVIATTPHLYRDGQRVQLTEPQK
ncbi:MAG: hypothetical protein CMI32_02570 [Opitutales bacterium]|nr:hypothetical protein [Opitutales bacterium]